MRAPDLLAELHPAQRKIALAARRWNVLCMGRRLGKTFLGLNRARQTLRRGQPVGWFAPTYKLSLEVWLDARRALRDEIASANKTEMRLELVNGGVLDFWTLDNPDAGRGRKYARVIIDEAAMVKNLMDAWQSSIRPTLTDLKGDAWFLSTPKGRNGFWQLYQLGLDPTQSEWMSWQMPTSANPYLDPAEIEAAREMLPERIYQQEYLAAFIQDSGFVFRRIMEAAIAEPQDVPQPNHHYVMGVDLARKVDFTVCIVLDVSVVPFAMVAMDRYNQTDWAVQIRRIQALAERFGIEAMFVDQTGVGDPVVEQMQRELRAQGAPAVPGMPRMRVTGVQFTNASKSNMVESLALAFEKNAIEIINDPNLTAELMAYDQERLPSGLIRYGAPAGTHDDCVMALALAWHGATLPPPPVNDIPASSGARSLR